MHLTIVCVIVGIEREFSPPPLSRWSGEMRWSLAEMERRRAFANRISNEPSDAIAIL
jgi:hypothetical protein